MKLYCDLIPDKKLRDKMRARVRNAIARCHIETCVSYPRYGAKGIRVHSEWIDDRMAFIEYLMTLPGWDNTKLELDRIDSVKGYEPGNLRFVTRIEQARNKDRVLTVAYQDRTFTLPDFFDTFCVGKGKYKQVQYMVRYWKLNGIEILHCLNNKLRPETIKGKRKIKQ